MKKLFVSHLIVLLLLILLVSTALAAPATAVRRLPLSPFWADKGGESFDAADCLNNSSDNIPGVKYYWSYYQYQDLTNCGAADLSTRQRYWSYYQNPPTTAAFADFSTGQRYWSYYQNPPASTIMLEIANK